MGAIPVLVEPDVVTLNIDANRIEAAITPKTRAILGTHLYGGPGPCAELDRLSQKWGLPVFWDAAQADGAASNAQPISQFG